MIKGESGKKGVYNTYGHCLKAFRAEYTYSSDQMNRLFGEWRDIVVKSAGILPISTDTKHLAVVVEELETFDNRDAYKTLSRQDKYVSKTRRELVRHFAGFLGYTVINKKASKFVGPNYNPHKVLDDAQLILDEMNKPELKCPPAPITNHRVDWMPYVLAGLIVVGICFIVRLLGL